MFLTSQLNTSFTIKPDAKDLDRTKTAKICNIFISSHRSITIKSFVISTLGTEKKSNEKESHYVNNRYTSKCIYKFVMQSIYLC